jgi:hypothetical protein
MLLPRMFHKSEMRVGGYQTKGQVHKTRPSYQKLGDRLLNLEIRVNSYRVRH